MLLIQIASTNVLLLLMILTAKVNCQLGQKFGPPAIKENQNKEVVDVAPLIHKLSGRQPDPRLNFDLSQYNNIRNAPSPPGPVAAGAQGPSELKVKVNTNGNGGPPPGQGLTPPPAPPPSQQPTPPPPPAAPAKPPSKSGDPSADFSTNGKESENDDKLHTLQRLVQELYVAQAQVQLEANEIQRAQSIAAAAQQALEEAANNVRMITAALHAAQQTVASAAIRAQTAQLQLAAHDQLLFAARQKVDALSAQIVSMQAEEGIQPTKMIVDLQALLSKLKEPLADAQKPTPVPSILGEGGGPKGKDIADGKIIHSAPEKCDEGMDITNYIQRPQEPIGSKTDESIDSLMARSSDLIHYSESLLHDNSDVPYDNSRKQKSNEELKQELGGLDENEVKSLVNFIVSLEHKQDEANDKQLTAGILGGDAGFRSAVNLQGIDPKIIEKSSDQRYINDFLEAIKNPKLKRDGSNQKSTDKDAKIDDYMEGLEEDFFKPARVIRTDDEAIETGENSDSDHIFNLENAFYIDSENFRESQP